MLMRPELYRMARRQLAGERNGHSIQSSSLVQETQLRLLQADVPWKDRIHFLAAAAQVMRHILVDHARRKRRGKRAGLTKDISIDTAQALTRPLEIEHLLLIDLTLQRLFALDERKGRVFEMRFFGGLEVEEVAQVLGVSGITVIRDWNFARAWLRRELGRGEAGTGGTMATG